MVITIWKYSNTLQVVSTTITKGVGKVTSRKGRDSITVKCTKGIITYWHHMGRVDCGYYHRLILEGFSNVSHFKKWYNKSYFGLSCFSFLQRILAFNLSVNIPEIPRRGSHPKLIDMKKWKFYSIAPKEMITYVDNEENQNF